MRVLLLAVLAVAFSDCTFGANTCSPNKPCADGATCDLSGFCIGSTDSGTGGGGSTFNCSPACAEWQRCSPRGCVNARVEAVSPQSGTVYNGGDAVRFVFRVLDWDGGVWPTATIPATTVGGVTGPSTLAKMGTTFEGDYVLASVTELQEVRAGWPEARASITVLAQTCNASCAPWEGCVPDADGGRCADLGLTLTWDVPTEDLKHAPNTPVPLSLSVTRSDGGAFAKPIPFTVSGGAPGTLTPMTGAWTGSVPSGGVDARRTLEAGWADGGPAHPLRNFLVDATPPLLGLVVASDGGAYQRDALIPAVLTSNEAIADAGVSLAGLAMARVATASCPSVPGAVACFLLDFSQPVLNALDGGFVASLSATDLYGNSGPGDGGELPVTRVRWQKEVTTAEALRAAPALGSDGTLYVGSQNIGDNAGSVFALSAADGNTKFGWPDGGVPLGAIQGLAVGNSALGEVVFYSANAARGVIGARLASDGGRGALQPECQGAASSKTYSGIGLMAIDFGAGTETVAVGALGVATGARPAAYRTGDACAIPGADTVNMAAPAVPTVTASATNVSINGTTAYFIGGGARVFSSTLSGGGWGASTPSRPTGAIAASVLAGSALYQLFNQGGWGLAVSGGASLGNLHVGALPSPVFTPISVGNNPVGMPALLYRPAGETGYVFAGVGSSPATVTRFTVSPLVTVGPQTSAFVSSAPVLGGGANKLGYAVDASGQLTVFSTQSFSTTSGWVATLPIPSANIVASPMLDCVRDATGAGLTARVGVLYVTSTAGSVTAILVDSPKLDDAQYAWPKYQRTAGNAGNIDPTLSLNPGCPP